jgi:hypothetical protein
MQAIAGAREAPAVGNRGDETEVADFEIHCPGRLLYVDEDTSSL